MAVPELTTYEAVIAPFTSIFRTVFLRKSSSAAA
jgi:hypothetical protein